MPQLYFLNLACVLRLALIWHSKYRIYGIYKMQSCGVPQVCRSIQPGATPFSITLRGFLPNVWTMQAGLWRLAASVLYQRSGQHDRRIVINVEEVVWACVRSRNANMCLRNVKTATPLRSLAQIPNTDPLIWEYWLPSFMPCLLSISIIFDETASSNYRCWPHAYASFVLDAAEWLTRRRGICHAINIAECTISPKYHDWSWSLGNNRYRVGLVVWQLGSVDLDLGSSPGWWAATVATYCPSRMVEHSKSKSTQPNCQTTSPTLYKRT